MTSQCNVCGSSATIDNGAACAQCGCDRDVTEQESRAHSFSSFLFCDGCGIVHEDADDFIICGCGRIAARMEWATPSQIAAESGNLCQRSAAIEIVRLRHQIRQTIMENLHLADGDTCSLKRLKDAIGFE